MTLTSGISHSLGYPVILEQKEKTVWLHQNTMGDGNLTGLVKELKTISVPPGVLSWVSRDQKLNSK